MFVGENEHQHFSQYTVSKVTDFVWN